MRTTPLQCRPMSRVFITFLNMKMFQYHPSLFFTIAVVMHNQQAGLTVNQKHGSIEMLFEQMTANQTARQLKGKRNR